MGLLARYRDRYRFYEQNYEARIDALQRQVEEQSMTMSMYSSYTPEDFNNIEEDIFGEYGKTGNGRFWLLELDFGVAMPRSIGPVFYQLCVTFQI